MKKRSSLIEIPENVDFSDLKLARDSASGVSHDLPIKSLALNTWAGRRHYAVEVVGETPKKYRVRILTRGGVMLPSRRYVNFGDTVLVPKYAVVDMPPAEIYKIEQGYYDGHIYGYGGEVDSRG